MAYRVFERAIRQSWEVHVLEHIVLDDLYARALVSEELQDAVNLAVIMLDLVHFLKLNSVTI